MNGYVRQICKCLYCGRQTGTFPVRTDEPKEKQVICFDCVRRSDRDEQKEIAAGMTPWVKRRSEAIHAA